MEPGVDPHKWRLSSSGISSMKDMAERSFWKSVKAIYHSPELKAVGTAVIVGEKWGIPLFEEHSLRELESRMGYLEREVFIKRVGDHLEGKAEDHLLESFDVARHRIVTGLDRMLTKHRDREESIAIVSHGRILTALYSHFLGRRLSRAEWLSIALPDISVVDYRDWTIREGFLSESVQANRSRGVGSGLTF